MQSRRKGKSLSDFTTMEILAFTVAWSPPASLEDFDAFPRWPLWRDFFKDWADVRDQVLTSEFVKRGDVPFADRVRAEMAANPDHVYRKHDHSALRHAHLYRDGDGHVHEGIVGGKLGPSEEIGVEAL